MRLLSLLLLPFALVAGRLVWTRLPGGPGERDDPLESAFATALSAVFLTGSAALLLAELGLLRPVTLTACLAAACAVLWRLPRRCPEAAAIPWWHLTAALMVLALVTVLVAPASEDLLGGRDAGAYANTAAWLAREGTLRVHSAALEATTSEWRHIFHADSLFPGFYIGHAASGTLVPQFLHLHPVYMAIGGWLGGRAGLLAVPPFFGVLAAFAIFLFVRRTLGTPAGVVAAGVLALNLAQIWGARTPFSEVPTQLGVFAALWCLAAASETGAVRWGVLGAVALGIGLLIRIDTAVLLAAMAPALLLVSAGRPGPQRWITHAFLPIAGLFAVWAGVHGLLLARPYIRDLMRLVLPLWTLTAVAVIACGAAALAAHRQMHALHERLHAYGARLWLAAALVLSAAFAFGLWIRPELEPFVVRPRSGARTYVEESLVRVGWYFSQPGMIAALAGVLLLLRRWLVDRRSEWLPFLTLFLALGLLYFWNPRIYPDHPWMMRRFLPVIVPGAAIAIAAAIQWLWTLPGRWRLAGRAAGIAVLGFVLVHEGLMAAPFWSLREKEGLIRQLEDVARLVPDDSLLLFTQPGAEAGVATPLALAWDRDVLPVVRLRDDPHGERRRERFERHVLDWLRDGREVLYLTAGDTAAVFLTRDVRWEEVAGIRIDVPTFGVRYDGPPRAPQRHALDYRLLRAVSALAAPRPCAGMAVHVGSRLGNAMQGVYGAESTPRVRFQWAMPSARVLFPSCRRDGAGRPDLLRVRASCGRVAAPEACTVDVSVNGERAGTLRLTRSFVDHDLPLPAAAIDEPAGPIDVRFDGPTFRPGGVDPRVLSFQVGSVSLVGRR